MENIMELVIDKSEEISVEMLKPLLASVKKDSEVQRLYAQTNVVLKQFMTF
ncbi:hypothetical protein Hanom_Chr04g00314481 [Helianthus anomalus]